MWGVANLGWMYYENWLHAQVPALSTVRMLFDSQGVFFAIALFLDKDKDSPSFDAETLFDSIQVAIVFFSAFFGLYYVQLLSGVSGPGPDLFMTWIYQVINVTLTVAAAIATLGVHTKRLRTLYGGMTVFLLINAISSGTADYMQTVHNVPTGTWYDLGWSLPFLACAIWAARWQEPAETSDIARKTAPAGKTLGALAIKNVMMALAPLIVLVVVAQLGAEWRWIGFLLLGASITCYAMRLGVSQYREAKTAELVQRDTLAMDSAMDGMAIISPQGNYTYVNAAFAKMMGHARPETMLGRPWVEMHAANDVGSVEHEIRAALQHDRKWFGPLTIHRDGQPLPIEMSVTMLPDRGVVTVGRDISDRYRAEQFREEAEAKYRTLVEQVAAISYIAELGSDGQWLYVSPQVETMFGFDVDDWLAGSRQWMRHVHPEDHAVVDAAEAASKRGERFQAEYRVIRQDGRVIWVSDTAVVVPGERFASADGRNHRRYHRAKTVRGAIAAGAADGSSGTIGRRYRARLQQSADHHQGLHGTRADASEGAPGAEGGRRAHRGCLGESLGAGAAIARVQPAAGSAAEGARSQWHRPRIGQIAEAVDGRRHRDAYDRGQTRGSDQG